MYYRSVIYQMETLKHRQCADPIKGYMANKLWLCDLGPECLKSLHVKARCSTLWIIRTCSLYKAPLGEFYSLIDLTQSRDSMSIMV